MMADDLQEVLQKAATATHEEHGETFHAISEEPKKHDAFVKEFGRKLQGLGKEFQREKPLTSSAGNESKPDLDITERGETVAHVEVKTGRGHNIDREQLRKYKEADGKDVYLVHFRKDEAVVEKI